MERTFNFKTPGAFNKALAIIHQVESYQLHSNNHKQSDNSVGFNVITDGSVHDTPVAVALKNKNLSTITVRYDDSIEVHLDKHFTTSGGIMAAPWEELGLTCPISAG